MYFDPSPKTTPEDLFGRESQLDVFKNSLTYASLVVVTGVRRAGKTSFVNVALSKSSRPFISLDMRELPYNPPQATIVRKLESAFNNMRVSTRGKRWFKKFLDGVKHVKGVNVIGSGISLDWTKKGVDLADLFGVIDRWAKKEKCRFIAAFDEVQSVRGEKQLTRLFAHVADNCRNVMLVFTGSEIELLFDFLGFEDPKSALYGRHYVGITMNNLDASEAERFLKAGFKQIRLDVSPEIMKYAVNHMDGIMGWLTLFGANCRDHKMCNKDLVDEVVHEGGKLARVEAEKMSKRAPRYGVVLNHLALKGPASWTGIKKVLEAEEGRTLTSPSVSGILSTLIKTSFIAKSDNKYYLVDPLLARGIEEKPL